MKERRPRSRTVGRSFLADRQVTCNHLDSSLKSRRPTHESTPVERSPARLTVELSDRPVYPTYGLARDDCSHQSRYNAAVDDGGPADRANRSSSRAGAPDNDGHGNLPRRFLCPRLMRWLIVPNVDTSNLECPARIQTALIDGLEDRW